MEVRSGASQNGREKAGGAYTDLRSWLERLEETGRLAIARPETNLKFALAGIANRNDGERATIFPNPSGHSGTVVSGLLSRRAWMAEALGIAEDELLRRFHQAEKHPLAPVEIEAAPCQEVVHEDDVDLAKLLPIPAHNEHDSGAYITAGLLISANPSTGAQNVAIHRLQLSGPRELGALLLPRHTLAFNDTAEAEGQDLPVAIVIGASPACLLASQAIVPIDFDELGIAGALCGAPLEVVRCKGFRASRSRPFGDRDRRPSQGQQEGAGRAVRRVPPVLRGERDDRHVIEVDRVTTRSKPLFHTIVGGGLEHLLLGGIPREATILAAMQRSHPGVVDVHLSRGGVCRYHLYVKLRRSRGWRSEERHHGRVRRLTTTSSMWLVVDEDVDIHNPTEVEWAVATRFQADRDLLVIPGSQGSKLDPSTDKGLGCKTGFDATVPATAPEFRFRRIRVPGEKDIDLKAVLDPSRKLRDILS